MAKTANLGKKPTEGVIDASLKMLTGDKGMEDHDLTDFDAIMGKAKTSFAGSAHGSALGGEGLLAPDVEELLQGVKAKLAKKRTDWFRGEVTFCDTCVPDQPYGCNPSP